jgi:hypothetical protein
MSPCSFSPDCGLAFSFERFQYPSVVGSHLLCFNTEKQRDAAFPTRKAAIAVLFLMLLRLQSDKKLQVGGFTELTDVAEHRALISEVPDSNIDQISAYPSRFLFYSQISSGECLDNFIYVTTAFFQTLWIGHLEVLGLEGRLTLK